jgi:hypothetical protein
MLGNIRRFPDLEVDYFRMVSAIFMPIVHVVSAIKFE